MESKPSDLAMESKPSDLAMESKPSDLAMESKPSDLASALDVFWSPTLQIWQFNTTMRIKNSETGLKSNC